jgi:hypothetical protein
LRAICVFCGSNPGVEPAYCRAAGELGQMLARRGVTLIYGGGNVGVMGALADGALRAGGKVIGVIPHGLVIKEAAHGGVTEMRVVDSMHQRKAMMADLSDGFIALPGGLGTLEETFEVVTWAQLGIHHKPCAMLNVAGYYDRLIDFLNFAVEQALIRPEHRETILVDDDPSRLLDRMAAYESSVSERWVGRDER